VEVVFHQGALPSVPRSVQDPLTTSAVNVEGTLNVLLAARDEGVRRVVAASSSSVYGVNAKVPFSESDPIFSAVSPYAASKLACEALGHTWHHIYGMDVAMLRFFTVYGPRQRPDMAFNIFCRNLQNGSPIELFGGDQTRDFTFVADVVAATRAAGTQPGVSGRVFNIGGGSQVSLTEVLRMLTNLSGRQPEVVRLDTQAGDVRDTGADISAAQAALSYSPSVTLEEGLRAEWEWLAESPK